ncbi:hypothetical protein ColTof4_04329 [Colletotrichum tofieldiae]|nr:hypothetical protein ColTof3_11466 [Colletotrichum tofieldiae]GKT71906.1 hypothetical protein ColTof4_04329 [Colletotrichum tofieldiae]
MALVSKGGRFMLLRPSPTPTRWIGTRGRRGPWALLSATVNTASAPPKWPSSAARTPAVYFSTHPSRRSGMSVRMSSFSIIPSLLARPIGALVPFIG